MIKSTVFLLVTAMIVTSGIFAQSFTLDAGNTTIKVSGTSTMHDWEMTAKEMKGSATMTINGTALEAISALSITVPVKSLESGKNLMNSKTYDAFNADKHPNITFVLKRVNTISPVGQNYMVRVTGDLTMNGQTRSVQIMAACSVSNGSLIIKGSQLIKMSDYKMDPPTAMMGSIKTGNDVTVLFDVRFNSTGSMLLQ